MISRQRLTASETHIWHAPLSSELLAELPDVLDEDDEQRARRFAFAQHRARFRCARTILRLLLANYLDADPRRLRLSYGPQGKPAVDGIEFNLSHAGDLAVFAFTLLSAVGVDIEELRDMPSARSIARLYFSSAERRALAGLDGDTSAAFLRCWTRKEAFVKALGGGLSIDLASFDVSVDKRARLLGVRDPAFCARDWRLYDLALPDAFVGAMALSRAPATHLVRQFSFAPERLLRAADA